MMECIKTGCVGFLGGHRGFIYGDAFIVNMRTLLIRVCYIGPAPEKAAVKHFDINSWHQWFDETRTSQNINSTLIVGPADYTYHGYEGVLI